MRLDARLFENPLDKRGRSGGLFVFEFRDRARKHQLAVFYIESFDFKIAPANQERLVFQADGSCLVRKGRNGKNSRHAHAVQVIEFELVRGVFWDLLCFFCFFQHIFSFSSRNCGILPVSYRLISLTIIFKNIKIYEQILKIGREMCV